MSARFCRACGEEFDSTDVFCGTCGVPRSGAFVEKPFAPAERANSPQPPGPNSSPSTGPSVPGVVTVASDKTVAVCGIVGSAGSIANWIFSTIRFLTAGYGSEYTAINLASAALNAFFFVGVPLVILAASLQLVLDRGTIHHLRFVAIGSFALFVARLPVLLVVLGTDYGWSDYFGGGFLGTVGRLFSLVIPFGLVCFAIFVVKQKLFLTVKAMRPSSSSVVIAVPVWFLSWLDTSSRWDFAPGLEVMTMAMIACLVLVMLLPGDLGSPAHLIWGLFFAVSAIVSLTVQVLALLLLSGSWGDNGQLLTHVLRCAAIVGLLFALVRQSGGLKHHLRNAQALAVP